MIRLSMIVGLLCCVLSPLRAEAQTGVNDLTWTPPTTNTDGSPLTDLAGYRVYWGTAQGTYPNSVLLTNPGLTAYRVTGLAVGTTYFYVVTARKATGAESAFSNVASAQAKAGPLNPAVPTNLRVVTPNVPVYAPLLTRNAQSMVQVGTAPAGVACFGQYSVRGLNVAEVLYLVRVEDVTLFAGVAPEAVFAPCAP